MPDETRARRSIAIGMPHDILSVEGIEQDVEHAVKILQKTTQLLAEMEDYLLAWRSAGIEPRHSFYLFHATEWVRSARQGAGMASNSMFHYRVAQKTEVKEAEAQAVQDVLDNSVERFEQEERDAQERAANDHS